MADASIWTETATLGTYNTGGISVATSLSSIANFSVKVKTRGALPPGHWEWSAAGGTATVKFIQHTYDRTTAVGNMTNLPGGVSAASSSGQSYVTDAAHVHSMAHDHAAVTSGAMISGTGATVTGIGGTYAAHTHGFDPPNFTGNTGAGSSHGHTWDNLYQHSHNTTQTATNTAQSELANATDLSSVTVTYHAVDG